MPSRRAAGRVLAAQQVGGVQPLGIITGLEQGEVLVGVGSVRAGRWAGRCGRARVPEGEVDAKIDLG